MATVYLADDVRHGRQVALKVLRPEVASAVGAERFLAEIETTAKLSHPHILPLFDSGEAGGFLFYVMPYVRGESLRDRLSREHELPVEDAVRIATQVAEALEHAHGLGVVHRDIIQASLVEPVSARTLLSTPAHEYNAFVSPDGRFYVYQTDRDGQYEVWVRPLGASADGPVFPSTVARIRAGRSTGLRSSFARPMRP
jgi:serine/threonine protein kinase